MKECEQERISCDGLLALSGALIAATLSFLAIYLPCRGLLHDRPLAFCTALVLSLVTLRLVQNSLSVLLKQRLKHR